MTGQHPHSSDAAQHQPSIATMTGTAPPQQVQVNNEGEQGGNRAVIPVGQHRPAAALAQPQQHREDNDLFIFIINRGWLFLRLYLFMFVFSEPGTWKRWLMIIGAAIICVQPRNGPINRLITAARRHFDNLVGPPAQQARPEAAAQQNAAVAEQPRAASPQDRFAAQRPVHVRGAVRDDT